MTQICVTELCNQVDIQQNTWEILIRKSIEKSILVVYFVWLHWNRSIVRTTIGIANNPAYKLPPCIMSSQIHKDNLVNKILSVGSFTNDISYVIQIPGNIYVVVIHFLPVGSILFWHTPWQLYRLFVCRNLLRKIEWEQMKFPSQLNYHETFTCKIVPDCIDEIIEQDCFIWELKFGLQSKPRIFRWCIWSGEYIFKLNMILDIAFTFLYPISICIGRSIMS